MANEILSGPQLKVLAGDLNQASCMTRKVEKPPVKLSEKLPEKITQIQK